MAILTLYTYPHPALRKKAEIITVFDEELKQLAADLLETMYDDEGVGLAANQVGIHQRIIVLDISDTYDEPLVLINPEIIASSGKAKSEEGCLSVPELYLDVPRAAEVSVRAQDVEGQYFQIDATDRFSFCLQHEIDHLDGKLFFDRLSPLKRQFVEKKLRKMACPT